MQIGKTVRMRYVEVDDAEFILKLRNDIRFNKYLSYVNASVADQKKWIINYKKREELEEEFYFIIETLEGVSCGTVRIYDIKSNSFCWGSWILNENKTKYAAIESAYLIYDFGFNKLGKNQSHFDVRKENKSVIKFHLKMGAIKVNEDNLNDYFIISKEKVENKRKELGRYLP